MTTKKAIGILAKILASVLREIYPGYEKDLQKVIDWRDEE